MALIIQNMGDNIPASIRKLQIDLYKWNEIFSIIINFFNHWESSVGDFDYSDISDFFLSFSLLWSMSSKSFWYFEIELLSSAFSTTNFYLFHTSTKFFNSELKLFIFSSYSWIIRFCCFIYSSLSDRVPVKSIHSWLMLSIYFSAVSLTMIISFLSVRFSFSISDISLSNYIFSCWSWSSTYSFIFHSYFISSISF